MMMKRLPVYFRGRGVSVASMLNATTSGSQDRRYPHRPIFDMGQAKRARVTAEQLEARHERR